MAAMQFEYTHTMQCTAAHSKGNERSVKLLNIRLSLTPLCPMEHGVNFHRSMTHFTGLKENAQITQSICIRYQHIVNAISQATTYALLKYPHITL